MAPIILCSADLPRMQEAGFLTGALREGKGGAWTDYTNGIATAWTGVKA
jgi:2-methoxy-6-polyprenyl-1,4-benzoquinol methylase